MKRDILFGAIAVFGTFLSTGCLTGYGGAVIDDPQGRYSLSVSDELEPVDRPGTEFAYFYEPIPMYAEVVVEQGADEDRALVNSFAKIGLDFHQLEETAAITMGDWKLFRYLDGIDGKDIALAYQYRDDTMYALVVRPEQPMDGDPPGPIMRMVGTWRFTELAGEIWHPRNRNDYESFVDGLVAEGGGISIAVSHKGEVIYRFATGMASLTTPATSDTIFHWGSITKIATATAILQQVDAGTVDLDAPVSQYIPELPRANTFTVKNLLNHSSGIPNLEVNQFIGMEDFALVSLEDVLAYYVPRADKSLFTPGESSAYNNWNFLLLGIIVERTTGETFSDYVRDHVFSPLGLERTDFDYRAMDGAHAASLVRADETKTLEQLMAFHGETGSDLIAAERDGIVQLKPINISPAWGGIRSTAEEATRLAQVFMNRGSLDGSRLLSRQSANAMTTMTRLSNGSPSGFGLGWHVGSDERGPFVEHHGGGPGINSMVIFYPKKDLAIAVMSNFTPINIDRAAGYAADLAIQRRLK